MVEGSGTAEKLALESELRLTWPPPEVKVMVNTSVSE
jgi:hypothetical protein